MCGVHTTLRGSSTAIAKLSSVQGAMGARKASISLVPTAVMFHEGFFHSQGMVGGTGAPRGYDDSYPCHELANKPKPHAALGYCSVISTKSAVAEGAALIEL